MTWRNKAGSSYDRGYDYAHRKRRAAMLPHYLGTRCQVRGPRCDGIMTVPQRMHLDHSGIPASQGGVGDRIICKPCNEWLGACRGRATQRRRRRASRAW